MKGAATTDPDRVALSPAERKALRPVFASLMLAMLIAALDHTTVATALPTIVGELGDLSHLAWVIAAYMLAATIAAPILGRASDQLGRKRVYMGAIAVFVLGGLLAGSATSLPQLIAFRAIQGLGGGGTIALTQTVIADVVSPRERGRYQALLGAVYGVASVAGPLLGGLFVDNVTWRLVFWMNVPLGILALVVIHRRLHLGPAQGSRRIDWVGAMLLTVSVTSLLLVITWGGSVLAWTSPALLALLAGGVLALLAFVWVQRRVTQPIVPLRLFRNRVFAIGCSLSTLAGLGMFGVIMFAPLYLQTVLGVSATASGLLMLPLMAGFVATNTASGRLITRFGRYKPFPVAGTIAMTAGVTWLSRLGVSTSQAEACLALGLVGLGLGMVMQVLVMAVQNAVRPADLGSATALVQFFRTIGGTVGVTFFGALLRAHLARSPIERISGGSVQDVLQSPARLADLPEPVLLAIREILADGITLLFTTSIPVVAAGIVLALLLPELPLGNRTGSEARDAGRASSPQGGG
jgi:EmrB/QacA subfamily drug resistance transporter